MKKTNINIRFGKKDDCDSILNIADSQLGKNYITKNVFDKMFNDGNFCMIAEVQKTKRVVGFCFCKLTDCLELKSVCKGYEIEELQFAKQIGYIKTIAVDEDFENLGIATQLFQNSLVKLQDEGAKAFFTTAWKNGNRINIAPLLTRAGFVKRIKLVNYWYENSIKEGFDCTKCGNPCHCTCVVYIKF